MIIKFKTREELFEFFKNYDIRDDELLAITLLLDDEKMLKDIK